jgi:hypothetical protein
MGSSMYYTCYVKFANETELLPNSTSATPNPLSSLYEYNSFIKNGENWEAPLIFQVNSITFHGNTSYISNITINGNNYSINKESERNTLKNEYYYNIFVELWIFNSTLNISQYHNRYVNLILSITQ